MRMGTSRIQWRLLPLSGSCSEDGGVVWRKVNMTIEADRETERGSFRWGVVEIDYQDRQKVIVTP